jgi:hypothetical protein
MVTTTSDEPFRELERELFAAHEGTPDLTVIDRLYADDFLSWEVRHTEVWANLNGRWRLVSWQGTSVPAET